LAGETKTQLPLATSDRVLVEAGDLGDPKDAAVSEPFGFEGRHPAALSFIQVLEEQTQLVVALTLGVISIRTTSGTRTRRQFDRRHEAIVNTSLRHGPKKWK